MLERVAIPNQPSDSTSITTSRADALNATIGSIDDCPICHGKGYIAREDARGGLVCSECECMVRKRTMRRIERSGLSGLLAEYTFDAYQTPEPWQQRAKDMALDYLRSGNAWFYMAGTPGSGKTHLCTAICGRLIDEGREVRYMLWRREAPRLKALVNERDEYEKLMREYRTAPVLYIDDFLKGTVNEADLNLAFELLNDRYNARNTMTIISSELPVGKVLERDEAIGSRIYQRARGYCITTPEVNWRLK